MKAWKLLKCNTFSCEIPFIQTELNEFEGTGEGPGHLVFRYGEYQERDLNNMWATMPKEGDMIFPSFLAHWVFPFKSKNVERISIALIIINEWHYETYNYNFTLSYLW